MEPNILALFPAIVAIGMAFATRLVLPSLFMGIVTGSVVLWLQTGNTADLNFLRVFLLPTAGSDSFGQLLLIYFWFLGGLLGVWAKTGAALHFAQTVGRKFAKTPKTALLYAWILGVVFHQGGTISTVLTGTAARPVAENNNVSHEELAYVVDSTASPIATLIPFNGWPPYIIGLATGTIALIPEGGNNLIWFYKAIPFNFYAIFAVLGTLAFSLGWLPWTGKAMKKAQNRARKTGKLDAPNASPMSSEDLSASNVPEGYTPALIDFILPLITLFSMIIIPMFIYGEPTLINEAFVSSSLIAMLIAALRGMSGKDILDGFTDGLRSMTLVAVILCLALALGTVSKELHTADYIASLVSGLDLTLLLPAFTTLFSMGIAFATGTSFGTYAVMFPVVLPLAYATNTDPVYVSIVFGALLGGAVFGDQCSPISDTTILSSMFTGCDLMDHVRTQLPMAFAAAILSMIASTISVLLFV